MVFNLHVLENQYWQVGILPETGASIVFGRVRQGNHWVDVMRPTDQADYDNPSNCSSFILLPWSNRIRDAHFRFNGVDYGLTVSGKDGTAIHGDTRRRPWQVDYADHARIDLSFHSVEHENINFPFKFSGKAAYWLNGPDLIMDLTLKNEDDLPMPGGFGHHPYFVRTDDVSLEIPYEQMYELTHSMPTGPAVPINAEIDFRTLRPLVAMTLDNLYTQRQGTAPVCIVYPNITLMMHSDPVFAHMIAYAPPGKPFFAVEPVTNINDGFNLYDQQMPNTGVFILAPGEEKFGSVRLQLLGAEFA